MLAPSRLNPLQSDHKMPIRSMHPTAFDKLKTAASRYANDKSELNLSEFLTAAEKLVEEYDRNRSKIYDLETRIETLERTINDWKRELRSARNTF